jgi:hypothetical protein
VPKKISLILCAFLLLAACAKKSEEQLPPVSQVPSIATPDLTQARRIIMSARVTCADARCNPSVAMLSIAFTKGAGACTGTLVGEDIVLTNSHCIPEDLQKPHSSCRGRIFANFPLDGRNLQFDRRLECDEVIFASEIGTDQNPKPDFAYFRVTKRSNRPFQAIERIGIADGESLELNKVDPDLTHGRIEGALRKNICRAVFGSTAVKNSNHPLSDLLLLADCDPIPGNSGSALIAASGGVRGVIQMQIKATTAEISKTKIKLLDGGFAPGGIGTNLACQEDRIGHHVLSPECRNPARQAALAGGNLGKSTQNQLIEKFNSKVHSRGYPLNTIEWTAGIEDKGDVRILTPQPSCVLLPPRASAPASGHVRIPRLSVQFGLDRYYRVNGALVENDSEGEDLSVSVSNIGGNAFAYVQDGSRSARKELTLKACEGR